VVRANGDQIRFVAHAGRRFVVESAAHLPRLMAQVFLSSCRSARFCWGGSRLTFIGFTRFSGEPRRPAVGGYRNSLSRAAEPTGPRSQPNIVFHPPECRPAHRRN
jgi:hypothetical protein